MIDLVTVVYRPELPYLELQGKSIENYFDSSFLGNIYVVVNDNKDVCNLIDKSWWGKYQEKVIIVHRQIYSPKPRVLGWESQQMYKLIAASRVYNPWSISLDAKTFFVRTCTENLLFSDNKVVVDPCEVMPVFLSSSQAVERTFNIALDKVIGPNGVPFIFHTETVAEMIKYIQDKTGTLFSEWFQQHVQYPDLITEFYLYAGYVKKKYGNIKALYIPGQRWACRNLADWEIDKYSDIYLQMIQKRILTVSIQAKAWQLLSSEQKLQYVNFLKTKNLTDDIEYTLEQLNTVVIN